MLQRTNVFPKDVSELKYASAWHEEDISLLGCVEDEIKKYNHRFRGRSERNLQIVYRCIGAAMAVYIESYPAAFSFKQQTKEFFLLWLEKIRHAYAIEDASIPDELVIGTKEKDTGIAMLKLLHSRAGVTYEELKDGLGGITERAIQKDLVKITVFYTFQSLFTRRFLSVIGFFVFVRDIDLPTITHIIPMLRMSQISPQS